MRWLILQHPLKGRKILKLDPKDEVDEIMKHNPNCEVEDITKSVGDENG